MARHQRKYDPPPKGGYPCCRCTVWTHFKSCENYRGTYKGYTSPKDRHRNREKTSVYNKGNEAWKALTEEEALWRKEHPEEAEAHEEDAQESEVEGKKERPKARRHRFLSRNKGTGQSVPLPWVRGTGHKKTSMFPLHRKSQLGHKVRPRELYKPVLEAPLQGQAPWIRVPEAAVRGTGLGRPVHSLHEELAKGTVAAVVRAIPTKARKAPLYTHISGQPSVGEPFKPRYVIPSYCLRECPMHGWVLYSCNHKHQKKSGA